MAQFTLSLAGDKKIEAILKNKMSIVRKDVMDEISASAQNIVKDAKRTAPVNYGRLRQSIGYKRETDGAIAMVSASYGAYIEFGTGGKVNIPQGFADYAAQFKGNKGGGNLGDMLEDLTEWVKKKGLAGTYSVKTQRRTGNRAARANQDLEVAYRIMWSILKNGIAPQPFFIPAYLAEKPKLVKRLEKLLSS